MEDFCGMNSVANCAYSNFWPTDIQPGIQMGATREIRASLSPPTPYAVPQCDGATSVSYTHLTLPTTPYV